MSVLIRNKPQATDILSDSQPVLLNNNNAIDTSFGTDHFAASDLTANNGLHNVITTPAYTVMGAVSITPPDTAANIPRFYAFQNVNMSAVPTDNIGVLQFSRGANNAVATPLTCIQSPQAGINVAAPGTANIFDFAGAPYCYGLVYVTFLYAAVQYRTMIYSFFWNGTLSAQGFVSLLTNLAPSQNLIQFSGSVLQISNSVAGSITSLAWTLEFKRIIQPT